METLDRIKDLLTSTVTLVTAVIAIYGWVVRPIRKLLERDAQQDQDLADLLWDRLQQAHDHFVKQGWCSAADKQRLIEMHTRYAAKGRNHLSASYEEDILHLPEHPPDRGDAA